MQCFYCFAELPEGSTVCEYCGTKLVAEEEQTAQTSYQMAQPSYQQSYEQPVQQSYQSSFQQSAQQSYQQMPNTYVPAPDRPMGWFYYLIYISLFYYVYRNGKMAIQMLAGTHYGEKEDAELIYYLFEDMKAVDVFFGICILLVAGYALVTRFALARYKEKGPKMLMGLYIISIVVCGLYLLAINKVVGGELDIDSLMVQYGINTASSIIMIFINRAYFSNREHLFVN